MAVKVCATYAAEERALSHGARVVCDIGDERTVIARPEDLRGEAREFGTGRGE